MIDGFFKAGLLQKTVRNTRSGRTSNLYQFTEPSAQGALWDTDPSAQNRDPSAQNQGAQCAGCADVSSTTEVVPPKKSARSRSLGMADLPENLQTKSFLNAWGEWEQHRKEIGHSLKPTTIAKQLKKLSTWGPERAIAALNHSMENGWHGIFEPKPHNGGNGPLSKDTTFAM